uniref:Uncharacterized protein n=1 Tax=Dulem virus 40 TaxID=3145758 RepID=A0AAU8AVP8_9CAUD
MNDVRVADKGDKPPFGQAIPSLPRSLNPINVV